MASRKCPSKNSRPAETPAPSPYLLDVREPHEFAIVDIGAPTHPRRRAGPEPPPPHLPQDHRNRRPLQVRCPQPARLPHPERERLHQRLQPGRRHPRLGRPYRSIPPKVLIDAHTRRPRSRHPRRPSPLQPFHRAPQPPRRSRLPCRRLRRHHRRRHLRPHPRCLPQALQARLLDAPKTSLTYERIPDRIDISTDATLASEQGHWIAKDFTGAITHTGAYYAMWRQTPNGWKLRSELFVTLTAT